MKGTLLACIVGGAAVVGGREERDQVTLSEAFKAVHDALMGTDNHLQLVVLQGVQAESRTVGVKAAKQKDRRNCLADQRFSGKT